MRNIVAVLTLTLYFLPSVSHAQELEKTDSIYRLLLITPGDTDLIIFEASLVAFDPLIDHLSNGEVLIKVIFNSGLAFAIFTAHHFLEGRMKSLIRRT